jgi:hypothetical protein
MVKISPTLLYALLLSLAVAINPETAILGQPGAVKNPVLSGMGTSNGT